MNYPHLVAAPAWPHSTKPNASALRRGCPRVACPTCGRTYPSNAMGSHRRRCYGPVPEVRVPQGHRQCGIEGCERIPSIGALRCWRHESRDARFAELDAKIAMGKGGA